MIASTSAEDAVRDIISKLGLGCHPAKGVPEVDWIKWLAGFQIPAFCPQCGKILAERNGAHGPFIGCTGYPKCRYTKPVEEQ